jgi:hypothetical protein
MAYIGILQSCCALGRLGVPNPRGYPTTTISITYFVPFFHKVTLTYTIQD